MGPSSDAESQVTEAYRRDRQPPSAGDRAGRGARTAQSG
jgi:hypothetical protein